jgi:hypothetical protein
MAVVALEAELAVIRPVSPDRPGLFDLQHQQGQGVQYLLRQSLKALSAFLDKVTCKTLSLMLSS